MLMQLVIMFVVCVFLVDIVTQMAKQLGLVSYNMFVCVLSEVVSFLAYFVYISYNNLNHQWYYLVLTAVFGICVAFAGMFGYDKFVQTIEQMKSKIKDAKDKIDK